MKMNKDKFVFPERGFYAVADKIAEADFFLDKLKEQSSGSFAAYKEYDFYFSAFLSASRSITFCLQWVMSPYPNFDEWYSPRQEKLRQSNLAKFFVDLRNYNQKTGLIPIFHSGFYSKGETKRFQDFFVPPNIKKIKDIPIQDVTLACEEYLKELLRVVSECYLDFSAFINPHTMFTEKGLELIGWSLEDLEESLGFPRGWTDIEWDGDDKTEQRLEALSRYGGDDLITEYFRKYDITFVEH